MGTEGEKSILGLFTDFRRKHRSTMELSPSLANDVNRLKTSVLDIHHAEVEGRAHKTSETVTNELLDQIEERLVRLLGKPEGKYGYGCHDKRYEVYDLAQAIQALHAIYKMRETISPKKPENTS